MAENSGKGMSSEEKLLAWLEKQEMVKNDLLSLLDEELSEEAAEATAGPPTESAPATPPTAKKTPGEEKRELLRKKMKEWANEGYNISILLSAIDSDDMDTLWEKFVSFMDGIEILEEIESRLKDITGKEKDPDYIYIKSNLKNPTMAEELLEKLEELEKKSDWRAKAEETVRLVLETKYKEWSALGYNLSELRELMENGSLNEVEEVFKEYEGWISQMEALKKELADMTIPKELEGEVVAIKSLMVDPTNVNRVSDLVKELKVKINKESKRQEYIKKLEEWRNEGLNVSRLESIIHDDLNKVMKAFFEYQRDVEALRSLEGRVDALLAKGASQADVEELYLMLNDPDKIREIQSRLNDIEAKLTAAKPVQGEAAQEETLSQEDVFAEEEGNADIDEDLLIETAVKSATEIHNGMNEAVLTVEPEPATPPSTEAIAQPDEAAAVEPEIPEEPMEDMIAMEESTPAGDEDDDLLQRIQKIRDMGLDTSALEKMLRESPREIVRQQVILAEQNAPKALEMIEALDNIKSKEHQEEIILLKDKLRNIKTFQMASKEYNDLFKKIKAEKEKKVATVLEHMQKQIEEWSSKGYIVDSTREMVELFAEEFANWKQSKQSISDLQGMIDGDLEIVWEDFKRIQEMINTAEKMKEELKQYLNGPMGDRAREIMEGLNDPDSVEMLEADFKALMEEASSLGEIEGKLAEFEKEGWSTDSVRKELATDPDNAGEILDRFASQVEELKSLKAELKALEEEHPAVATDNLYTSTMSMCSDVRNIQIVRENIEKLKEAVSRPIEEPEEGPVEEASESSGGNTPEELLEMGSAAYGRGDYESAIEFFEKVLELDPGNKKALFYKKRALASMKKKSSSSGVAKPRGFKGIKIIPELEKIKPDPNCPVCHGSGKCNSCNGTGKCYWCDGSGKCSECGGTGKVNGNVCASCNGTGLCEWCGGKGECYWCHGTGKCDKCVLVKAEEQGIKLK